MDCSQILPGAVNAGPCSLATGYYNDHPFIVYASGMDVVIVDGRLKHIQTLLGSDLGYGETPITCVHCAEQVGKIAVAWGSDVVIFQPEPLDENHGQCSNEFIGQWQLSHTIPLDYHVLSLSWNKEGKQLLVGGDLVTLWSFQSPDALCTPDREVILGHGEGGEIVCSEDWRCQLAFPTFHLNFSPDGAMFATAGMDDHFVKIWYPSRTGTGGLGTGHLFSYAYVAHPMTVTGLVWRKTSSFMPKGCVPNVLLTYCSDNICRIWSHTITKERPIRLHFFIAASIDPIADIPFRSMTPIEGMPFLVHWLNNKETTFTSKAEKTQKGAFLPISRHSSLASFASSINEDMLQSWVCIEDTQPPPEEPSSDSEHSRKPPHVISFDNYLRPTSLSAHRSSPGHQDAAASRAAVTKKLFAQLMDEWCNSPDLLLCIHPGTGSLMVWTVEGLDSAHTTSRLVHVSFSSCLPHIFPPHLAQSLHQGLLQYLIKEPDVVHTREMALTGSLADISIPVPQIRLPSGGTVTGSMTDIMKHGRGDVPKTKADTSLILVSSHQNGSIHAWSVELTVQSNYYTSIAGLIHWGGTGGHHSEVRAVYRHPWLPVLMTVSTEDSRSVVDREGWGEEGKEGRGSRVDNELIIWNAHLPGPLEHKSHLRELSRMSSSSPLSFHYMTWVPPISVSNVATEGVLARSPSTGLFVSNVGKELRLFQTSLYCASKGHPQQHDSKDSGAQTDVYITSHFGKEGIRLVGVIEKDISQFEEIVSLHAFRLCSLVTSFDIKKSLDAKFGSDVVIALIENRESHTPPPSADNSGSGTRHSYLHVWRVVISTFQVPTSSHPGASHPRTSHPGASQTHEAASTHASQQGYHAKVEKVLCTALPLPHGAYVKHSTTACDIASSLQLQLPTLSAAFLFTTACSDGTIRCWQLSAKLTSDQIPPPSSSNLEFELHEVFIGSASPSGEYCYRGSSGLDLREKEELQDFPLESDIPCAIANAYAGRLAMAHLLTRAPDAPLLPRRSTVNPLGRYAAVTIWECESTGGFKWQCEANLLLSGVGGISSEAKATQMNVHLEWLPMENGAYLLATCFESIISIFGMALPQVEGDFTKLISSHKSKFLRKESSAAIFAAESSKVSWVCLLQFPCAKRYPGLSISQFAYTGSNSLLISVGTEIHIYSCMVRGSKLETFTPAQQERRVLSKTPSRVFRHKETSEDSGKLSDSDIINLLDYAHARNTPLPQYHPKILLDLMNSGKLQAVKAILVNLVKYLLLYETQKRMRGHSGDEHEYSPEFGFKEEEEEEHGSRKRMLSVSSDGQLRRSRKVGPKIEVETIPSLSLSKLGIFTKSTPSLETQQEGEGGEQKAEEEEDDLFAFAAEAATPREEFSFNFEERGKELAFDELDPLTNDFSPEMASKLTSILHYAQLSDLSDLEQVRLMAIAETVANTKMAFESQTARETGMASSDSGPSGTSLGLTSGAGYASTSLTHGVGGGEAMDDCGLRYLLALQNYSSLSESLPPGVRPGYLAPSDFIWAFHSDSELELLAAIPCIQRDKLTWPELRNAGVGWWVRSPETLRRLMEKLAKTQFMNSQNPLDASLLYLAMKKKSLLKGLFKTVSEARMTQFFGQDFTQERWKKAALKNAFALLSKQRFEQAAAFFLLGDKLWDACEVCISRLGDLQLSLVITRLYEGEGGPVYQKILKEYVLGIDTAAPSTTARGGASLEPSPDPFLRSIACWLLQDYSAALETLLVTPGKSHSIADSKSAGSEGPPDPSIFNFYIFLRSHPLLIRRNQLDFRSRSAGSRSVLPPSSQLPRASQQPVSSVGDEPLTPMERSLLFSTAYHHLNHGCPLLALDVLSKLPKSSSLGADLNADQNQAGSNMNGLLENGPLSSEAARAIPTASLTGMIQSGTLGDFAFSSKQGLGRGGGGGGGVGGGGGGLEDDDFDWSQPVSSQQGRQEEEEELDWSQPVSQHLLQRVGEGTDEDFDWGQPVASQFDRLNGSPGLSPPHFGGSGEESGSPSETNHQADSAESDVGSSSSPVTLSSQGLFVLSLAEQLQYNACLSILTEELNTIYLPSCCEFLWKSEGKESLPLLPLAKRHDETSLSAHHRDDAFEKTVLSLRGMLVVWLRREMATVKDICGFEKSKEEAEEASTNYVPAGYDLLTTLMNYASLHAGTNPSLTTVKLELMHLMNTLLPWSTNPTKVEQDLEGEALASLPSGVPVCAVDPSQLPILTSCSLPATHLTNLALHLRLMSASIIEVLANHTRPPISSKPLPNVSKVFELCCAISHSITVCLSPMSFAEIAPGIFKTATGGSTGTSTPVAHGSGSHHELSSMQSSELRQKSRLSPRMPQGRPRSGGSFSVTTEMLDALGKPNTRPSKWPGVAKWPKSLQSDEGKDPTPLSLILAECCIAVYVGLLSVAWSWHSIRDLLLLLKNSPEKNFWHKAFGGGMDMRRDEEKGKRGGRGGGGGGERSALMSKVDTMTKRIRMLRRTTSEPEEVPPFGLFVAPKNTLLDLFLCSNEPDSGMDMGIVFKTQASISEASTVSAGGDEDFSFDPDVEEGPSFRLGSISHEDDVRDPKNPDSFTWCLMNLCITKLVQAGVRNVISTAGLEVLELVTASPLLYSTLKVLDEWESIFARRLDALGIAPEELFTNEEDDSAMFTAMGPAVMRHKFILEPENSPFQGRNKTARQAHQLWQHLVHQDDCRETFIHYIFANKMVGEDSTDSGPNCRSLYKAADSVVSSFCIHPGAQVNPTIMAVALPREVIEIEIPDTAGLDTVPYGDNSVDASAMGTGTTPKRSQTVAHMGTGDFVMVQATTYMSSRGSAATLDTKKYFSQGIHAQTGTSSSILLRRSIAGVKKIAPHPTLAYYLTGSIDGSVKMWEFGTQRPVSIQRQPGAASVTEIRFTPQGNKYGVTDTSGKLHLWQGIHTSTKTPYQVLNSGMRYLSDFLFLGSSSLIAACGDTHDNRNLIIWDTLLPAKRNIVKEYVCHDGGASVLSYSQQKQRILSGGKKGEICIFDIRQNTLLHSLQVHTSAINCMAINDVDGYIVTGSSEGDVKVLDLTSMDEIASYPAQHSKSRLFRQEGGVTKLCIKPGGKLYSCGADGSIRCRTLS